MGRHVHQLEPIVRASILSNIMVPYSEYKLQYHIHKMDLNMIRSVV